MVHKNNKKQNNGDLEKEKKLLCFCWEFHLHEMKEFERQNSRQYTQCRILIYFRFSKMELLIAEITAYTN